MRNSELRIRNSLRIPNSDFRILNSDDPRFADGRHLTQFVDRLVQRARSVGVLVDVDDADRAAPFAAAEREVGDVDAVAAEDGADLADDARLIVVGDDRASCPPSGASTSTPRTETSRGLFGSNTVPSTQRSPSSVVQLDRHQAGEMRATASCATRRCRCRAPGRRRARSRSRRRSTGSAAARRRPRWRRARPRRGLSASAP